MGWSRHDEEFRADHERDHRKHDPRPRDLPASQRVALCKLIGYCEGIAAGGLLGDKEFQLRALIAENLTAFGMPSKTEREAANA